MGPHIITGSPHSYFKEYFNSFSLQHLHRASVPSSLTSFNIYLCNENYMLGNLPDKNIEKTNQHQSTQQCTINNRLGKFVQLEANTSNTNPISQYSHLPSVSVPEIMKFRPYHTMYLCNAPKLTRYPAANRQPFL